MPLTFFDDVTPFFQVELLHLGETAAETVAYTNYSLPEALLMLEGVCIVQS